MEIRVLGPVEVRRSGEILDLGGPKQLTVLALLVANNGIAISTERLINGTYGPDAPDGARRTVQVYVSNLKKQLGDAISSSGRGYILEPNGWTIDAVEFDRVVKAGRGMIDDDPQAAGRLLRQALATWRGHPFEGVETWGLLTPEVTRLNELRMAALEGRIEADLAVGHDRELIGELEALTIEHPLREAFRYQHMLALYRSGRQAEALRAYQSTRRYLADEMGIVPSPDLRKLEQQILDQDVTLSLPGPTSVRRGAVLVVDVVVETAMTMAAPDVRSRALDELNDALTAAVLDSGGTVAAQQATATYASFDGIAPALRAAEAVVTAAPMVVNASLVRAAVDYGDIEEDPQGAIGGPAVIRAAGLAAAANPGQILLSSGAQHAATDSASTEWTMRSLGLHTIRRVESEQPVYQLVVDGLNTRFPPLKTNGASIVLPTDPVVVPGYELRERIGRGMFGTVYRGYQPSVGREVALKVINPELANDPAFIRRFAVEARVIARLEHPHVVPLIDYWRGPDQALLVMQLMRGGNLAERTATVPLDEIDTGRFVYQAGCALAAAHDIGIVHGDVQARNILLNDAGDFFVADFGIASDAVHRRDMNRATDVAALARLIGAVAAPDTLTEAETGVLEAARELRYENAAVFVDEWQAAGDDAAPKALLLTQTRNPYKGLGAFGEADTEDFHGRDNLIAELVSAVDRQRLVAAVGPSGVGKSSTVSAGLIPALRSGAVTGSEDWFVTEFSPGSLPFEHLASALMRLATSMPRDLEESLEVDPRGLIRSAERYLPAKSHLLLFVDQFEELFTMTKDEGVRSRFLEQLWTAAIDTSANIHIVIALRADFFDRPLQHQRFGELMRTGIVPISAPTDDELREIITAPAEGVGIAFESGLVERIVSEVHGEAGALPLVEFTLTELFQRRTSDLIALDAYDVLGGVAAALAGRAEEIFDRLGSAGRAATRQVFLRLVVPGDGGRDTRRRVRVSELRQMKDSASAVDRVLDDFGRPRLLVFDRDAVTRGPTVEVAHEALLREWPRLSDWIDGHREELVLRAGLASAMAEWIQNGRQDGYLLSGGRLAHHETWVAATDLTLTQPELDYIRASRRADNQLSRVRQRRRRGVMSGFAAAALVAFVLAGLALNASTRADARGRDAITQRNLAESNATRAEALAADALLGQGRLLAANDPELAAIALSEVAARAPGPRVAGAISEILFGSQLATIDVPFGGSRALATNLNHDIVAIGTSEGPILLVDAKTLNTTTTLNGARAETFALQFSPGGDVLAATDRSGELTVWDVATGQTLWGPVTADSREGGSRLGAINAVDFSPDGQVIATGGAFGIVRLWDAGTGDLIGEIPIPTTMVGLEGRAAESVESFPNLSVRGLAFDRTGDRLAISGLLGLAAIWDTTTGEFTTQLRGHPGHVWAIEFSPDGEQVVTAGDDAIVRFWDGNSGEMLASLSGHTRWIHSIAMSPDLKTMATGGLGEVIIWNLEGGSWLPSGRTEQSRSVGFVGDGSVLAVSSGDARLYSTAHGEQLGLPVDGRARLLRVVKYRNGDSELITGGADGVLRFWNPANLSKPPIELQVHQDDELLSLAISPDEALVAIGTNGGALWLLDTTTGEHQIIDEAHDNFLQALAFDSSGQILVSGGDDDVIRAWSVDDLASLGVELRPDHPEELPVDNRGIRGLHFREDGLLMSTGRDGFLRLWDLESRTQIGEALEAHDGEINAFDYNAASQTLLTASDDFLVKVWDANTLALVHVFEGHTGELRDAELSPDGSLAASVAGDQTVRLWDTISGEAIAVFEGHIGRAVGVTFTPDGSRAVSGGLDGTLRWWDTTWETWPARLCEWMSLPVSLEQWEAVMGDAPYEPACQSG